MSLYRRLASYQRASRRLGSGNHRSSADKKARQRFSRHLSSHDPLHHRSTSPSSYTVHILLPIRRAHATSSRTLRRSKEKSHHRVKRSSSRVEFLLGRH